MLASKSSWDGDHVMIEEVGQWYQHGALPGALHSRTTANSHKSRQRALRLKRETAGFHHAECPAQVLGFVSQPRSLKRKA